MSDTPAAAMTDVASAPSHPLPISAASSLSLGASAASRLLYKDTLQIIFAFLPIADLRSANSVSQQWHAALSARQVEALRVARLTAQLRSGLWSSDAEKQALAVQAVHTINRSDKDIRAFLPLLTEPAMFSGLIGLLSHPSAIVASDAALALGNIIAGPSERMAIIEHHGALSTLVRCMGSTHADLQDNAMYCLAKISARGVNWRHDVIAAGALAQMTIQAAAPVWVLRSAADLLRHLCESWPPRSRAACDTALPLPVLVQLLQSDDEQVLTKASYALLCLSDDRTPDNKQIQAILDCGAVPRLIALLGHSSADVREVILRVLVNLVSGSEAQTQTVLNAGLAAALRPLVMAGNRAERKNACWVIANVVAETPAQIQFVIDADLLPPIIAQLTTGEEDVRKEAAWCAASVLSYGSDEQIRVVVSLGLLPALMSFLKGSSDLPTVLACLKGVEHLLRVGAEAAAAAVAHSTNVYAAALEAHGARETIAALQSHHDEPIATLATKLMSSFG